MATQSNVRNQQVNLDNWFWTVLPLSLEAQAFKISGGSVGRMTNSGLWEDSEFITMTEKIFIYE